MPRKKSADESRSNNRMRPALTPDARDNQMIALAYDAAEQQIRDGTASSQVITHFLKLGSSKERLEREKLRLENELTQAKTEQIKSLKKIEELYSNALMAMKHYNGNDDDESDEYDDYDEYEEYND